MSLKRKTSKGIKREGEGNMETDFPFKHEDGTGGKQRTQNACLKIDQCKTAYILFSR